MQAAAISPEFQATVSPTVELAIQPPAINPYVNDEHSTFKVVLPYPTASNTFKHTADNSDVNELVRLSM